jgi:teichuronic acid exporter
LDSSKPTETPTTLTQPEIPGSPEPGATKPGATKSGSLASHLAWRALADWSSQLVSWAALLVVVRLLSSSDFGLVGMSVVLFWYLKLLGEFGITATVIRNRHYTEEILAQLNTMGLVFGIASFLLACLFAYPAARFFKTPGVVPVAIVTCIGLIPLGVRAVSEGLMNRELRFNTLSLLNAFRDIASAVITVLLAWLGFRYWALVLGNLVADLGRSITILVMQPHRFARPRWSTLREPLAFGLRVLISGFAWSTYNTLDNVTAGRVLGQSALGLYAMAWNLANMPLEKIVSLVTTLIPAYLSKVQKDLPALRHYVRSLTEMISLSTFPATIGFALVAGEGIPLILGRKWIGMIAPLQVLCVYAAVRSIVAILPKVLTASGNPQFVMRIEVMGLFIMPICFWIGSHWGLRGIAYGWVFGYPVVALSEYWKTMKIIQMGVGDYFKALRPALDGSIAMILGVLGLQRLLPAFSPWVRLLVEIGGGAALYIGTVTLLHHERARHFLNIAMRVRKPKVAGVVMAGS